MAFLLWVKSPSVEMARLSRHTFQHEPQQATYLELVDFCCRFATHLVVVVRDQARGGRTTPVTRKLVQLTPYLTAMSRGGAVSGRDEDRVIVCRHRIVPGLRDTVKSIATRLFEWADPRLPEDPCFLREDGAALLVTLSGARDAYLLLRDDEERSVLEREYPRLAAILREPVVVAGATPDDPEALRPKPEA